MVELVGVLAALLELIGIYYIGNRKIIGWIINIAGNVCWLYFVYLLGSAYGLILLAVFSIILNARGYRNWKATKE